MTAAAEIRCVTLRRGRLLAMSRVAMSREFVDRNGDSWRVWSTVPADARGCLTGYADGWLTFERNGAGGERRRLAPIPPEWERAPDAKLLLWCRVAEPARALGRRTPPAGIAAVPDDSAMRARENGDR